MFDVAKALTFYRLLFILKSETMILKGASHDIMGRKWNNIKEKKASRDENTSRIYAKFGIEIYAAAKQGTADPESNRVLKTVLDRAKTYHVPKAIIDRALEKARGGGEEQYVKRCYEGFGPQGSMIIVEALTNNVNRTASDVRTAFHKNGGSMGVSGSVSYMFDFTAVIGVEGYTLEEAMDIVLTEELDVKDMVQEEKVIIVYAESQQFYAVQEAFKRAGVTHFRILEQVFIPRNEVTLPQNEQLPFEKLLNALDQLDDVQQVYHNVCEQ